MTRAEAEMKMAAARDLLAAAERLLREVETACREAGMDDDQGNVDVVGRVYDCCEEIEAEGLSLLE